MKMKLEYCIERDGITASLLTEYLLCKRKFLYSINRWTSKDQKSFLFGSLSHDILEQLYKSKNPKNFDITSHIIKDYDESNYSIDIPILVILLNKYKEYFKNDFEKYTEFNPESEFDIKWNGFRLRGKRDLLYRNKETDTLGIMEHKNYSEISSDEIMQQVLKINLQILFYTVVSEIEFQEEVGEVQYNILRVPRYKVSEGETEDEFLNRFEKEVNKKPEHFFKRYPIVFTRQQKKEFRAELSYALDDIHSMLSDCSHYTNNSLKEAFYRNHTACKARQYQCSFLESCTNNKMINCKQKERLFSELK